MVVIFKVISGIIENLGEISAGSVMLLIASNMIASLITVGLDYFVYNRTNSYWGFVGGVMGISIVMGIIMVIMAFLGFTIRLNVVASGLLAG